MNWIIILVFIIISVLVGAVMGVRLFRRPIKIEFKISPFESFMYAFEMFFIITMVMSVELLINQWNILYFNPTNWWLKFLGRAIDGGALVAAALPLLSLLFSKWIKGLNLDLCGGYSINFVKIYYSVVILANCVWFLIMAGADVANDNAEAQSILNRVIIWMLNVVGTWAGIGFRCEGRITEELDNIKRSKEKKTIKQTLMYSIPFAIAFVVNCLLLLMQTLNIRWLQVMFLVLYCVVMCGLVGMIISIWILKYIEYPSEKRSDRKLAEAISEIDDKKIVTGRYQKIQYSLINQEDKKYLRIHERTVIWSGHEEEIKSCFGERNEPVEKFDYEECKMYLMKLKESRKECVQKGYILCEEEVKRQLIEHNKN